MDFILSLVAPILMTALGLMMAFAAGIAVDQITIRRITPMVISVLFMALAAALWILLGIRFWGEA